MYNVFLVFYVFIKLLFTSILFKNPSNKVQVSAYCLFHTTFRTPQSERYSLLLVLIKYLEFVRTLFFRKKTAKNIFISEGKNGLYVYDIFETSYQQRKNYVNYFSSDKISGGIFKNELYYSSSNTESFLVFIIATLVLPIIFI